MCALLWVPDLGLLCPQFCILTWQTREFQGPKFIGVLAWPGLAKERARLRVVLRHGFRFGSWCLFGALPRSMGSNGKYEEHLLGTSKMSTLWENCDHRLWTAGEGIVVPVLGCECLLAGEKLCPMANDQNCLAPRDARKMEHVGGWMSLTNTKSRQAERAGSRNSNTRQSMA